MEFSGSMSMSKDGYHAEVGKVEKNKAILPRLPGWQQPLTMDVGTPPSLRTTILSPMVMASI